MRSAARLTCTCVPGARCDQCHIRGRATLGLLRAACDRREMDEVTYWDRRTSLADYRAALCLAIGVPPERINPASGHKLATFSRRTA